MKPESKLREYLGGHTVLILAVISLIGLSLACGGSGGEPTPGERPSRETPTPAIDQPANTPLSSDEEQPTSEPAITPAESPTESFPVESEPEPVVYEPDGKACNRVDFSAVFHSGRGQNPLGLDEEPDAVLFKLAADDTRFGYAAFSPDGEMIVTAGGNKLGLWDATSGGQRWLLAFENFIGRPAFDPDSHLLAISNGNQNVFILDSAGGDQRRILPVSAKALAFTPDGETLAVASGRVVHLYQVESGEDVRRYEGQVLEESSGFFAGDTIANGHALQITSIDFNANGEVMLTAGTDGTVRLWETSTGTHLRCYEAEEDGTVPIRSAELSPDGLLIVGLQDESIYLWDALSGEILQQIEAELGSYFGSANFSPDGKTILSASEDQTARSWSVVDGRVEALMAHPDVVNWAAYSPSGNKVVAAIGSGLAFSGDPSIHEAWIWDAGHPDLILAAEAQNLVSQAVEQMTADDVDSAQELFQQAQSLNPFRERDLEFEGQALGAQALLEQGVEVALYDDARGAMITFQQAQLVHPDPDDNQLETGISLALDQLGKRVEESAKSGQIADALEAVATAESLAPDQTLDATALNTLCRYGSLWGQAAEVIQYCETAVSLTTFNYSLAAVRDSRGIALAMLGDSRGAINDFTFYIENRADDPSSAKEVAIRRAWIADLRTGRNPFDRGTLEMLRKG